ncbi:MAG: hypothetical protein LBH25_14555 [Fibromonadaceae bacterium]|jgi:hypothetical protein|nr:hypothetical protein [Fibromonadaceae bacterium]
MRQISLPDWLTWIDKNLKWLSIPKLPLLLTIIQALGFIFTYEKPEFVFRLVLDPNAVLRGEIWRIFTFIAIPLVSNPILVLFVLCFLYYIMVELESIWGATLLTVYFLLAWFCSVLAAILIGIPIETFFYMELSFFFALATLNPNRTIYLFFILPIAFKWIAVFTAIVLFASPLFLYSFPQLLYIILLFANYLIFFGKDYWLRFKKEFDKRKKI